MQYRRLTTQEQEKLAEEFATFLASNSIDKTKWDDLKKEESAKAEELLDVFSDMIFDQALTSCKYLERVSETAIHTYLYQSEQGHLISVRVINGVEVNFLEGNLSEVFMQLLNNKNLEVHQGIKKYQDKRELEMFEILKTGGVMSSGELYQSFLKIL